MNVRDRRGGVLVEHRRAGLHRGFPVLTGGPFDDDHTAARGTTVTAKLVSLGHITRKAEFRRAFAASSVHDTFNLVTVSLLYPLEYFFHILEHAATWMGRIFVDVTGITKPENYLKKITQPTIEGLADLLDKIPWLVLLVSVVITFFMLWAIVKLLQSLVLKKLESFFDTYVFRNLAMSFVVGLILTVMVQSSSITTSLIVPLAGAGVLRLQQIFPFTIGANIGTTITGLLAALAVAGQPDIDPEFVLAGATRSEERRVGKEFRSRWSPYH